MKPLAKTELAKFSKRFENFQNAEFRSVEIISAFEIALTVAVQDSSREFDWITLKLLFSEISDAKLVEDSKLPYIDLEDGISLLALDDSVAFAIGECYNISTVKSSIFYIICKSLKYEEGSF